MSVSPVIDRTEAIVLAAVMQSLRTGSALPIRRPSWSDPTFFSRPLVQTTIRPIAPTATWVNVLRFTTLVQMFTVIREYAVATLEPMDPAVQFRIQVDGGNPQGVSQPAGVDVCKDPDDPWPLQRRKFPLVLNQPHVLTIDVLNGAFFPKTVIVGLWGWHYPTIATERSTVGQGNTDA